MHACVCSIQQLTDESLRRFIPECGAGCDLEGAIRQLDNPNVVARVDHLPGKRPLLRTKSSEIHCTHKTSMHIHNKLQFWIILWFVRSTYFCGISQKVEVSEKRCSCLWKFNFFLALFQPLWPFFLAEMRDNGRDQRARQRVIPLLSVFVFPVGET